MDRKRIGILTWHCYSNYGSALQAYALQTTIALFGYRPLILNYVNLKFGKHSILKKEIANVLHFVVSAIPGKKAAYFGFPFTGFQKKYLKETKPFQICQNVSKIAEQEHIDAIVYGSDQIWAPNCFNPIYFGAGIDGKKIPKISYAASIGLREIPQELKEQYQSLLGDFAAISVRESDGKALLNQLGIDNISVVLDPTLLLDVQDYKKLERKPHGFSGDDYVFCYFLNKDHTYRDAAEKMARERNLRILGVSAAQDDDWMQSVGKIGPREFLYYVHHAMTIVTDSYHGAIFSLLYHKELHIFERFSCENPINQNSRIEQLQRWFDLKDCIVPGDCQDLPQVDIDYIGFEEKRSAAKSASMNYLEEALQNAFVYQR